MASVRQVTYELLRAHGLTTIFGNPGSNELLFLKSSANIQGDIVTGKLVVESGATFTGSCNMGPMIKDINSSPAEASAKAGSGV